MRRELRLKGRLFQLLAAVSLVLSLASFVLQYRGVDVELMRREGAGPRVVAVEDGKLSLSWEPRVEYRPGWAGQVNRYGFRYNVYSDGSWYAWGPIWVVGAVFAAIAAIFAGLARGPRRRRVGLCPVCGYDLRATPERCPECGAAPKAEQVAT